MEIIALLLLYVLSQKPDFSESVKPLFGNLKNTEDLLKFLNDLNKFSEFFSAFKQTPPNAPKGENAENAPKGKNAPNAASPPNENNAAPQAPQSSQPPPKSPTSGIASEYIENCLNAYFKKR